MIRATTALLPPGVGYTIGDAMFANASLWPGDDDVIRLDRNMCDPRRELVDQLLGLFFDTVEFFAPRAQISDPVAFVDARVRARANVPKAQTSLF